VQVPQGERTDLDLAVADIQQGRFDQGEDRLQRFLESYPGSPLTARARYWLGQSHFTRGNYSDAARSFLAGYQVEQTGDLAARNLLHLGITLGRLGQQREACLTLREVRSRFVSGDASILNAADSEADRLACGR
jgi:tol-pal system protein YbgF